jgi:large subunit ribosomal protein L9
MKVLLRRNVKKLGVIGDVVVVRDGYARNYPIPKGLATVPSEANLRAIEREKEAYLAELAQQKTELETQAKLLSGREFSISARANPEGHLYGSIGPAQIAAAIGEEGIAVDPGDIVLDEPIRRLDKYEVPVRFAEDVEAKVVLWVVPTHDSDVPDTEQAESERREQAEDADSGQPQPAGQDEPEQAS